MSQGIVRFPDLDLQGEIAQIRLTDGQIEVFAILPGPGTIPAGEHLVVVYGWDGRQICALRQSVPQDHIVTFTEHVAVTIRLTVETCIPREAGAGAP